ncbi:MAG: hypothetical protein ACYCW6_21305 [Candidatus Xenobia bacterium]
MTRGRCPVCQAAFRGTVACSRCGADLTELMTLEAAAWRCREAARAGLRRGDFSRLHQQSRLAQEFCPTPEGEALRRLGAWLVAERSREQTTVGVANLS